MKCHFPYQLEDFLSINCSIGGFIFKVLFGMKGSILLLESRIPFIMVVNAS